MILQLHRNPKRRHSLMIFHFYIIARYQSLFAFELGPKPIDVVFHVDHLKNNLYRSGTLYCTPGTQWRWQPRNKPQSSNQTHIRPPLKGLNTKNTKITHPEQATLFEAQFIGRRGFEVMLGGGFHSWFGASVPVRSKHICYRRTEIAWHTGVCKKKKNKRRTDCTGTRSVII